MNVCDKCGQIIRPQPSYEQNIRFKRLIEISELPESEREAAHREMDENPIYGGPFNN